VGVRVVGHFALYFRKSCHHLLVIVGYIGLNRLVDKDGRSVLHVHVHRDQSV